MPCPRMCGCCLGLCRAGEPICLLKQGRAKPAGRFSSTRSTSCHGIGLACQCYAAAAAGVKARAARPKVLLADDIGHLTERTFVPLACLHALRLRDADAGFDGRHLTSSWKLCLHSGARNMLRFLVPGGQFLRHRRESFRKFTNLAMPHIRTITCDAGLSMFQAPVGGEVLG